MSEFTMVQDDETPQGKIMTLNDIVHPTQRKLYIESYGCQMNFADSDIIRSIMANEGFTNTAEYPGADVIFINTCSIRENAELRVRNRLKNFAAVKQKKPDLIIGILGCMAERLKKQLLEEEKLVDLVAGPDAYRDLPALIKTVEDGSKAVNVLLSREETYADINPVRLSNNGVTAFVSIMRGCNNMCSFCVVPYTRGRERSRDINSILNEIDDLYQNGYREVTLLGQNVDSYHWKKEQTSVNFAQLIEAVALSQPDMRIRFSTSHPKDLTNEVLKVMKRYTNLCKAIHLPVQSGSSRILTLMNRSYDRNGYLDRIRTIKSILPECAISTDIITGFCSETEDDHQSTLRLMEEVRFDYAYMFTYSERPGTPAAKKHKDDVPTETKSRRLNEIIDLQRSHSFLNLKNNIGTIQNVLIEGLSKKSNKSYCGRSDGNAMVVFPEKGDCTKQGVYVNVLIEQCTKATLIGQVIP